MKETLGVIKTIERTRDPGDAVENEVANFETLNLGTFFCMPFVNLQVLLWSWI